MLCICCWCLVRLDFVNSQPLFLAWTPRHKRQLAYSLQKELVAFDEHIVKQTNRAKLMYFLLKYVTARSTQCPQCLVSSRLLEYDVCL